MKFDTFCYIFFFRVDVNLDGNQTTMMSVGLTIWLIVKINVINIYFLYFFAVDSF